MFVSNHIGSLNEKSLHANLKQWYAQPNDQFEVSVDGFVIDVVRDDLLIEIQTRSFSSMKRKLLKLTETHPVCLVHPIAQEKWIVKLAGDEQTEQSRRKSPKRGTVYEVFRELVSFPQLMGNPNFSLHILLIQEEEARRYDGRRGWRRKGWVTHERRLLAVVDEHHFAAPKDMQALLPETLASPFTTSDLAKALKQPRWLMQKMAYCLREMGAIEPVGKQGNAILYQIAAGQPPPDGG
jgi:hypothetical protein